MLFLATSGAKRPMCCQFFQGKMSSIISRALYELEINPLPSRRCFSLLALLKERLEFVYKQHPRYNDTRTYILDLDISSPMDLPYALRGEKWTFTQLPLSQLRKEVREVDEGKIFGTSFDDRIFSVVRPETLIPGVAVFSRRASPLAGWTNSLELATITADIERSCLILDTGINTSWRYGSYKKNKAIDQETQAWEKTKKFAHGIHFLTIQPNLQSDEVTGIWLLRVREVPGF